MHPSSQPSPDASVPSALSRQAKRGILRRRLAPNRFSRRRSPLTLVLLILLWSAILGAGLAQAQTFPRSETIAQVTNPDPAGLVDAVPSELQFGQELYLENCATCHVGLPPAVMPTESWRRIMTEPAHYGVEITPLSEPSIYIAWNYVSRYSRPLTEDEPIPFRLRSSRYFKALHPKVEFSERVGVRTCITCHPAAEQFNYRSLTAEWENAP
ncbi:MAG: hypothetical protein Kow00121_66010 [Elainellaceae cyanobacterium]